METYEFKRFNQERIFQPLSDLTGYGTRYET